MKRVVPLLAIFLLSCKYLPGESTPSRNQAEAPAPVIAPPGSREDSTLEAYDRLAARADALKATRPIEALRLYRLALANAPHTVTPQERSRLEAQVRQLAFVLGVPQSEAEAPPAAEAALSASVPGQSENLARARTLYAQAQEAEYGARKQEALGHYRQLLKLIREQDDPTLYWNAWQKVEDLSPEGEGPAAVQERQDRSEAALESKLESSTSDEDGSALPAAQTSPDGMRVADVNLSQARAQYIKGMGYAKAQDKPLARQAFQQVLDLIRESQDPELYRAARQNLQDLGVDRSTRDLDIEP